MCKLTKMVKSADIQGATEQQLSANEQICKLCKGFKLADIQGATLVQAVIRWRRMPSASH